MSDERRRRTRTKGNRVRPHPGPLLQERGWLRGRLVGRSGTALSPTRTGWNLAEACRGLRMSGERRRRERGGTKSDLTLALSSKRGDGFEAVWWVGRAPLARPPERAGTLQRLADERRTTATNENEGESSPTSPWP